jgi:hypothetical protein
VLVWNVWGRLIVNGGTLQVVVLAILDRRAIAGLRCITLISLNSRIVGHSKFAAILYCANLHGMIDKSRHVVGYSDSIADGSQGT